MPLVHGYTKAAFVKNLRLLRSEDYPPKQAMAICFSTARAALEKAGKRETERLRILWNEAIPLGLASKPKKAAKRPKKAAKRPKKAAKRPKKAAKRPKKTAKRPKKAAKRPTQTAKQMSGRGLLLAYGPPSGWSGFVGAWLGPERRAKVKKIWLAMTPRQRAEVKVAFAGKRNEGLRKVVNKVATRGVRKRAGSFKVGDSKKFWSFETTYPLTRENYAKMREIDRTIERAARGTWWFSDAGHPANRGRPDRSIGLKFSTEEAAKAAMKRVKALRLAGATYRIVRV